MQTILKAGILLGVVASVWGWVVGLTGLYKHPTLSFIFLPVVILINVAILIWGLRATAREGRGYGGQVVAGLLIALIGGVIIVVSSLILTSVAIPEYAEETLALQEEMLVRAGLPEDQIDMRLAVAEKMTTPTMQAVFGFVGTVVTSLVVSLIAAIFIRKK